MGLGIITMKNDTPHKKNTPRTIEPDAGLEESFSWFSKLTRSTVKLEKAGSIFIRAIRLLSDKYKLWVKSYH